MYITNYKQAEVLYASVKDDGYAEEESIMALAIRMKNLCNITTYDLLRFQDGAVGLPRISKTPPSKWEPLVLS